MKGMSEWVKVGVTKRGLDQGKDMCLRKEIRFLKQKVWDSIRMSDRMGGQCMLLKIVQ